MQRLPRLPILLLISGAALLALHAQQKAKKSAADLPRRFAILAPYIPTVSGLPFSARYIVQMDKVLTGGSSETWHSIKQVARDSSGRTRCELHDSVPASFTKEPPLSGVVLTDPPARLTHILDPVLQTDDRHWFHAPHPGQTIFDSSQGEDLGTKTIDGIEVKGVRRTWMRPSRTPASGPSFQVVDETWYSNELQIVVSELQTDSLGRGVSITLSHFDRGEPDPSLFKVPHGYHVLTPTTFSSGPEWGTAIPTADCCAPGP